MCESNQYGVGTVCNNRIRFCFLWQTFFRLLECRAKARIPQRAKSVIVCLFPYHVAEPQRRNISRYAMVEDYHIVAGNMLKAACERLKSAFPENEFVFFTDNSPIREVSSAVRAGLGVLGKNGLLIHPKYGSFVFIGEIVTDLTVPGAKANGMCIGCGRCAAAWSGRCDQSGGHRQRTLSLPHHPEKRNADAGRGNAGPERKQPVGL